MDQQKVSLLNFGKIIFWLWPGNQKFCIFVSKAQNEQGILLAVWLRLCVRMHFESANFVSSQKKAGQCVYFMKECGVFHDEFDPSSRDKSSDN